MSRLRVRIELNRGGVGVPLNKLASVVQQSQSFFRMLGDDVHIDQSQGDWLGFDFDHESLNFTAEFVGAVTQEQVAAFHAAFDGTTPLRRATIAQFARIADAIEEDEVIGFGLYLNESDDPGEWRCLSRRDALRIAEEIQVLLGAGQVGQDSHLPAAADVSTSARYMFGRRDRGVEAAKLTGVVREVEASLSKRISRLEDDVADHSGHIQDLRSKSLEAEQSMGRLLSAVEGFCEQAAIRLETVTAPALSAAAAAGAARAPAARSSGTPTRVLPGVFQVFQGRSHAEAGCCARRGSEARDQGRGIAGGIDICGSSIPAQGRLARYDGSTLQGARAIDLVAIPHGDCGRSEHRGDSAGHTALADWLELPADPVTAATAPASAPAVTANPNACDPHPGEVRRPISPVGSQQAPKASASAVPGATRIELIASEPTWVSIRGKRRNHAAVGSRSNRAKTQSVDIRQTAVLRAGNAGGLTIRANGKSLGPLGPHGAVRDVEFKNGDFKLIPIQ